MRYPYLDTIDKHCAHDFVPHGETSSQNLFRYDVPVGHPLILQQRNHLVVQRNDIYSTIITNNGTTVDGHFKQQHRHKLQCVEDQQIQGGAKKTDY